MVTLYLGFHAAPDGPAPEDRKDGEIADGAGELGFFPPYSWWPLWCALTLAVCVFGVALRAWWLFIIGGVLGALALQRLDLRVLPRRARPLSRLAAAPDGATREVATSRRYRPGSGPAGYAVKRSLHDSSTGSLRMSKIVSARPARAAVSRAVAGALPWASQPRSERQRRRRTVPGRALRRAAEAADAGGPRRSKLTTNVKNRHGRAGRHGGRGQRHDGTLEHGRGVLARGQALPGARSPRTRRLDGHGPARARARPTRVTHRRRGGDGEQVTPHLPRSTPRTSPSTSRPTRRSRRCRARPSASACR